MALSFTQNGVAVENNNLNGIKAEQDDCGGVTLEAVVDGNIDVALVVDEEVVARCEFKSLGQYGHEHFRDGTYTLIVTNEETGIEEYQMVLTEAQPRRIIMYVMGAPDGSNPGDNLEGGNPGGGDLLSKLMQALGGGGPVNDAPLDDGNIGADGSGLGYGDTDAGNDGKTIN
jgi:hypothetical protein